MASSQRTSPNNRRLKKSTHVEEWVKGKISLSFCMLLHMLYNVVCDGFKKSMVSSLEKLYFGLDPDDATFCE